MGNFKTYTITIGKVYNGDKECKNPKIELAGRSDIATNCTLIDPTCGEFTVQIGPNDEKPCLKFIVTCEECDICPPVVIEKCFCDSIDDCGDCDNCIGGFCEKICDKCCDGTCCDCETDADCPCNQLCVNGDCKCPIGTTLNPLTECCDECNTDVDCPPCEVCKIVDGVKTCVPIECPDGQCDITGRCGPIGECVECINSGGCPKNECCSSDCGCDCCPGFTRVGGVCVKADCQVDDDCGACEICRSNRCTPRICPKGEVPILVNCDGGAEECDCGPVCDCSNPDCSKRTDRCIDSIFPGICGCTPCCGDCSSGCADPCICDDDIDACVFNPCQNQPCSNGLDCPIGCGCLNGECVACDILSCQTTDCLKALGCACNDKNECEADRGCPPTPCAIADDCPFGCTCYGGVCVDCSLFPCPTECADQDNCACVAGNCEGSENDCTDTVTLEKSDADCTLTGTLTKDNCCACPALTLDVKNTSVSIGVDSVDLTFIGEVRKGSYDGVSVDGKPIVDEFGHPDIAENEPPTSGTFRMAYTVGYDVFDVEVINGVEQLFYAGYSEDAPLPSSASFAGGIGTVNFPNLSVPTIGFTIDLGTQRKIVSLIKFEFILLNALEFPNDCIYDAGLVIGSFSILDNNDFNNLAPEAVTATSLVCRKPFFKWTKSQDSNFNEFPFRKVYVDPIANNVWADVLTAEEELESCFYYLFEPDCTCDSPESKYIVFCNPEDITYNLKKCNTEFELLAPFDPCDVNEDEIFRVQAGTIDRTFTALEAAGVADGGVIWTETSDTEIEEIIYSIVCDTEGICTKTYPVVPLLTTAEVQTQCILGGTKIVATFIAPEVCEIAQVTILETGDIISGTVLNIELDPGSYTARILWACGCDTEDVPFSDDCCEDFILSQCDRDCEGKVVGCQNDANVTYFTTDGSQIPSNSLYDYVSGLASTQPISLTAKQGSCDDKFINRGAVNDNCCSNFTLKFVADGFDDSKGIITVYNGTNPTVTTDEAGIIITDNGDSTFSVSGLELDVQVTFTASDGVCEDQTVNVVPGECALDVNILDIDAEICDFVAEVNPETCTCPEPQFDVTITSVTDQDSEYGVSWETAFIPVDAELVTGQLVLKYKDKFGVYVLEPQAGLLDNSGTVSIPKAAITLGDCQPLTYGFRLYDDFGEDSVYPLKVIIGTTEANASGIGDTILTTDGIVTISSLQVRINGTVALHEGGGIYSVDNCCSNGDSAHIAYTIGGDNGKTYSTTYLTGVLAIDDFYDTVSEDICSDAQESNAPVEFIIIANSIYTEDDCTYDEVTSTFEVSNGVATPGIIGTPQSVLLTPTYPTARDVKFTWLRMSDSVEYVDYDELKSTLTTELLVDGAPYLEQGTQYRVTADCIPCSDVDVDRYCCLPNIVTDVLGCNTSVNIFLTGLAGFYEINYNLQVYTIFVPIGAPGTLNIPGPLFFTAGTINPLGVSQCVKAFQVEFEEECEPTYQIGECLNDEFSITVVGCTGSTLVVTNGNYGSVLGQTITSVDRYNPVSFTITALNGCVTTVTPANYVNGCDGITLMPTPSPTAAPAVPTLNPTSGTPMPSTLNPTSGTLMPTPSPTPGPTPSPATPEPSPAPTTPMPAVTPMPSLAPTPAPAVTPMPSLAPTPGPTPSPAITPMPSLAPTPGPTPSPTPGPTPAPSVTLMPSASATCYGVPYDESLFNCCEITPS